MNSKKNAYTHDASDKKLAQEADEAKAALAESEAKHASGPGHDPSKIARHDDVGKDRLFEHREQHDDAEKKSEKSRLAKEASKTAPPDDESASPA